MIPSALSAQAEVRAQHDRLRAILTEMGSVIVGLSGGIDSSLVLKVAHDVLGARAVAATSVSPTLAASELAAARAAAAEIGARHILIETELLDQPDFYNNPSSRCYTCKHDLYTRLAARAREHDCAWIANGTNQDDLSDFRPGLQAAKELGVRSPLLEAAMTKQQVRTLAQVLGLTNWSKPADACLSSRFPLGTMITEDRLHRVERAEAVLKAAGFGQVRVRYDHDTARIEVAPDDFARLLESDRRAAIVDALRRIGFRYVTVDLEGYRQSGLNQGGTT